MKKLHKMLEPYFAYWQTEPDITAVEKYIVDNIDENKFCFINYDTISNKKIVQEISMDIMWNANVEKEYIIQNKPIYLYNTEEKKDLFELLKMLWEY